MLFLAQHYFSTTKDKWRASSFVPWFPRMRFPSSTIALLAVAVALLCAKTLIGICFLEAPQFTRTSGWTAHVLEQLADNRLIRPQSVYIGPVGLKVVPVEQH